MLGANPGREAEGSCTGALRKPSIDGVGCSDIVNWENGLRECVVDGGVDAERPGMSSGS